MCDTNGVDSDRVLGTKEKVLIMMIRSFLPVGQGHFIVSSLMSIQKKE